MIPNVYMVCCSPAGSTQYVADVIEKALQCHSLQILTLNLGLQRKHSNMRNLIANAQNNDCLFIGSPVYRDVAIPPVMAFIDALTLVEGCWAVPFVTWGGACSGVALWQMGKALESKGFRLAGAAKVLSVHSMMWHNSNPIGAGHPDAADVRQLELLVDSMFTGFKQGDLKPLRLAELDYQLVSEAVGMKQKINQPWLIVPKKVHADRCSECGVCKEE